MRMKVALSWRTSAALVIVATVVAALLAGRPLEFSMLWDVAILAAIVGPPLTALLVVYYRHACLRALLRLFRQTRHLHRASPQTTSYRLCLAGLVLGGGLWVMSHIITVYAQFPRQGARFVCFEHSRGSRLLYMPLPLGHSALNPPFFFGRSRIRGPNGETHSFLTVAVPYWGICGLVAIYPLITLWRTFLRVRRERDRHCESCHYNLTGNTSGVCPECGAKIEIEQTPDAPRTSPDGSSC